VDQQLVLLVCLVMPHREDGHREKASSWYCGCVEDWELSKPCLVRLSLLECSQCRAVIDPPREFRNRGYVDFEWMGVACTGETRRLLLLLLSIYIYSELNCN
jgi:hypothetical protein